MAPYPGEASSVLCPHLNLEKRFLLCPAQNVVGVSGPCAEGLALSPSGCVTSCHHLLCPWQPHTGTWLRAGLAPNSEAAVWLFLRRAPAAAPGSINAGGRSRLGDQGRWGAHTLLLLYPKDEDLGRSRKSFSEGTARIFKEEKGEGEACISPVSPPKPPKPSRRVAQEARQTRWRTFSGHTRTELDPGSSEPLSFIV